MGKRSEFKRVDKDYYPTIDIRAWHALKPHLPKSFTYAEPCYGKGHLSRMIEGDATYVSDLEDDGIDALTLTHDDMCMSDYIITNPPWSRQILHQMIEHFSSLRPTWLLFDADWAHTKQSAPYMHLCSDIVSIGRLIWIEGTNTSGKDNCAWYKFDKNHNGPTIFHGRR